MGIQRKCIMTLPHATSLRFSSDFFDAVGQRFRGGARGDKYTIIFFFFFSLLFPFTPHLSLKISF